MVKVHLINDDKRYLDPFFCEKVLNGKEPGSKDMAKYCLRETANLRVFILAKIPHEVVGTPFKEIENYLMAGT